MSKNNIIGLVIIVGLLIGYSLWMAPSKAELAAAKHRNDSIALVQHADSLVKAIAEKDKNSKPDSTSTAKTANPDTPAGDTTGKGFVPTSKKADKFYTLENDLLKLKISSLGGRIWSVQLKDGDRLIDATRYEVSCTSSDGWPRIDCWHDAV